MERLAQLRHRKMAKNKEEQGLPIAVRGTVGPSNLQRTPAAFTTEETDSLLSCHRSLQISAAFTQQILAFTDAKLLRLSRAWDLDW